MMRDYFMKGKIYCVLLVLASMWSLGLWAQNVAVRGTVTDSNGETLIGVNVVQRERQTEQ